MSRIHIKDLPKDMKIGKDIMKQIRGGISRRTTDSLARKKLALLARKSMEESGNFISIIDIDS